jgi:hypothetical protein
VPFLYGPVDTRGTGINPWVHVVVDITGDMTPGNTYQLQVSAFDIYDYTDTGVDSFSIVTTEAAAVPEPGTLIPLALGLALVGIFRLRRRFQN